MCVVICICIYTHVQMEAQSWVPVCTWECTSVLCMCRRVCMSARRGLMLTLVFSWIIFQCIYRGVLSQVEPRAHRQHLASLARQFAPGIPSLPPGCWNNKWAPHLPSFPVSSGTWTAALTFAGQALFHGAIFPALLDCISFLYFRCLWTACPSKGMKLSKSGLKSQQVSSDVDQGLKGIVLCFRTIPALPEDLS